jgi:hypothetical protein
MLLPRERYEGLLYPKLRLDLLPAMLGYAGLGAFIAGFYGVLHDQITYSISPEYFTRLKFLQFRYADFGLPPRVFVGEIGFLATWWVGLIAGWFLARVAVPALPGRNARAGILRGFATMLACGFLAALVGFLVGLRLGPDSDLSVWQGFVTTRGVVDLPNFVRVAYIHNASYLGGLIGLIVALLYLRRQKSKVATAPASCQLS